jgi:2-keto-4-pentenoate hydratase/2-oxohepta-3-ene-1,7-dioic acid hydratase in catechol pathway
VRFVTFRSDDGPKPGLVVGEEVADLSGDFGSVLDIISTGATADAEKVASSAPLKRLDELTLDAPVRPPSVYCVGWNYLRHFEEGAGKMDVELPEHPAFFSKSRGSVIGPFDDIPLHASVTKQLDWEAELTVVIGRPLRDGSPDDSLEYVFGYMVGNDVSARELQKRHGGQWLKGKGLDGTCPLGPWIVTADEIPDPQSLGVTSRVNGETKQDSSTDRMIFPVAELLARLSEGMTLHPGDVLLTGTPEGVGMGRSPQEFLGGGDVVECEVSGIGAIRNAVRG